MSEGLLDGLRPAFHLSDGTAVYWCDLERWRKQAEDALRSQNVIPVDFRKKERE
jgi:hypothetical protein